MRFSKSRIPIYNSEIQDTAGRKMRRRRTQAVAKRFSFRANTKNTQFKKIIVNVQNFYKSLKLDRSNTRLGLLRSSTIGLIIQITANCVHLHLGPTT